MPISNPTSVPGCMLWLDAADPTTLFQDTAGTITATDNTVVRRWSDKSGNGLFFSNHGSLTALPVFTTLNNELCALSFNSNTSLGLAVGNTITFQNLPSPSFLSSSTTYRISNNPTLSTFNITNLNGTAVALGPTGSSITPGVTRATTSTGASYVIESLSLSQFTVTTTSLTAGSTTFTQFLTGNVTNFRYLTGGATIFSVCQPLSAAGQEIPSVSYWTFGNIGAAGGIFVANKAISLGATTGSLTNESITFSHESATATGGRLGSSTYRRYSNTAELITTTISNTGTVIYQNGRIIPLNLTSGITTTTNTSPSAAGVTVSDNMILNGGRSSGVNSAGPSNFWREFIIYGRVLSQSERIDVEDYIKTKWNLSDPIYNVYAIKNGPLSDPATWLNNTKPMSSTDVWTNGRLVDVNENVTALSFRTTLNGGTFNIKTPVTITLLGDGIVTGSENCITSYLGGTEEVTVIGKIQGSTTTANKVGIYNSETGIIRCISPGGVRAGTQSGAHGATPGDAGVLFVTGPCYGSDSTSTAYGVYNPYVGYTNIVGDIYAGTLSPGYAFNGAIDLACTIRVTGNIYASLGACGLQDIGSSKTDAADIKLCSSFRAGANGDQAIDIYKFLLFPKPYASYTKQVSATNSPIVQYSAVDDYSIYLHPEAKDTQLGIRYGALTLSGIPFQLEGTMGIPDRTAVSYNTPVGNSLGVGIVSLSSLQMAWQAPQTSLKIKGTIGQRANAAAQIKEFGDLLSKQNV